jgi:hypothetical protein
LFSNLSDSGISADDSPIEKANNNDDDMMLRVKQVLDKGKFKGVTTRSFTTPKKTFVPFRLPDSNREPPFLFLLC